MATVVTTVNDARLVFDAEAHRYTLVDRELISVTAALQAAGMVDQRYWNDASRVRGSYLHMAIALFAEGALDDSTIDPELRGYFDGFTRFLEETRAEILASEVRVCDPALGYAGTFDAIIKWPSGRLELIDWKSGAFPPMAGPQTAGYLRCARALYPVGTSIARAGLQLPGNGTYTRIPLTNIVQDEHDFLAALRVAQFRSRHGIQ